MDSTRHKANIVLDNVMYLGKKCLLRAHNKPFCISNREALCMDNKKQYYFRSCNILTKNEDIQTIGDFSAGNKPFCNNISTTLYSIH